MYLYPLSQVVITSYSIHYTKLYDRIMPIEAKSPVEDTIAFLRAMPLTRQQRLSFEYIVFAGINDSLRHVNGIAKLLDGLRCRINIIRWHRIPEVELEGSTTRDLEKFRDQLLAKGFRVTIRKSRGEDISAACGMLSTRITSYNVCYTKLLRLHYFFVAVADGIRPHRKRCMLLVILVPGGHSLLLSLGSG